MFERFIDNHRKLAMALFVFVVIGLVIGGIYTVSNQSTNNTAPNNSPDIQNSSSLESTQTAYSNDLYTISNPTGSQNNIIIDTFNGYRNAAVSHLYNEGFDPTDFKITFKNYESPFTPYE